MFELGHIPHLQESKNRLAQNQGQHNSIADQLSFKSLNMSSPQKFRKYEGSLANQKKYSTTLNLPAKDELSHFSAEIERDSHLKAISSQNENSLTDGNFTVMDIGQPGEYYTCEECKNFEIPKDILDPSAITLDENMEIDALLKCQAKTGESVSHQSQKNSKISLVY